MEEFNGKNNQSMKWHGRYRGIAWEISARKSYDSEWSQRKIDWCHYIYIQLDQLPEDSREGFWLKPRQAELPVSKRNFVSYDYFDSPISGLTWHGGITFYEKRGGVDGESRMIKAGCDYQHLWDDGQHYTFESVLFEVKETIDSLHAQFHGIGIWCGDGYCAKEWHLESDGVYSENKDSFRCQFCIEKRIKEAEEKKSLV